MKLLKLVLVSAAAACPQERPFAQKTGVGAAAVNFCCPTTTLVQPISGQTQNNACTVCTKTLANALNPENCDNYVEPPSNNPVAGNNPLAGTPPAWAVQCPIKHPFSKYKANTNTVESCCKCQSQTKCIPSAGANYPNPGGATAMMANNDVVDKKGLMCDKGCSATEECRYDKENCEYKCCVKWAVVWGVVGALLGLLALALLGLLIWCCCCRKKKKVAPPPPVVKPRTPTPPPPVIKTPEPIPSSSSSSSSEEVIIQKEVPVAKPKTPTPSPPPVPSSSSSSTSSSETSVEVIRTPTPPPPKPRTPTPPPPREPTPPPPPSSSSSSSAAPSPIIKKWTPLENPTVVYASYARSTNSEDERKPQRKPSFNADWTANSRVVDSDYEGGNPMLSKKREVDMDDYKMHNVSGLQDQSTLWKNQGENKARSVNPSTKPTSYSTNRSNPLNSTGIGSTNNRFGSNNNRSGSPVAIRRQSPPRVRREYN